MKKILFLLFLLYSFCSAAQKIHFTDTSNIWMVHHTAGGPPPSSYWHQFKYRNNADTIIHSTSYKMVEAYFGGAWSSYPCSSSACVPYTFVREDTLLNKVFMLSNDTEQVLMDYNLKIGDSITHKDYIKNWVFIDTVSGLDSVIINSVYHKVWYFNQVYDSPSTTPSTFRYSVIEGIGCLLGPFYMPYPNWGLDQFTLTCFNNNGVEPLVSPSVPYWYLGAYFDNQVSCTLGIPVQGLGALQASVYPNPATTHITITTPIKIATLTITNLLGQTICTQNHNSEVVEIDVSTFPSGIYLVKINGTEVKKFIKQ